MKNLKELDHEELIYINGGGEKYAEVFGMAVRYSAAATLGGPIAAGALMIYDFFN